MGFWTGSTYNAMRGKLLFPVIDNVLTYPREMDFELTGLSMRLRSNLFGSNANTHRIASNKKYKFKFLAKDIPNVRSLFVIHGQRYICERNVRADERRVLAGRGLIPDRQSLRT